MKQQHVAKWHPPVRMTTHYGDISQKSQQVLALPFTLATTVYSKRLATPGQPWMVFMKTPRHEEPGDAGLMSPRNAQRTVFWATVTTSRGGLSGCGMSGDQRLMQPFLSVRQLLSRLSML